MKYVIFKYASLYMPVIIPQHVTHSQIKIEGAKPISAGFFYLKNGSVFVQNEISESLKLGPNKRDEEILQKVFGCHGTSSFLDFNTK